MGPQASTDRLSQLATKTARPQIDPRQVKTASCQLRAETEMGTVCLKARQLSLIISLLCAIDYCRNLVRHNCRVSSPTTPSWLNSERKKYFRQSAPSKTSMKSSKILRPWLLTRCDLVYIIIKYLFTLGGNTRMINQCNRVLIVNLRHSYSNNVTNTVSTETIQTDNQLSDEKLTKNGKDYTITTLLFSIYMQKADICFIILQRVEG